MLDPTKKDTPHPRAKEKPQQDGRRGKTAFRSKPHTRQRCLEGSNKTLCSPGDPQSLSQTCLCMFEYLLPRCGTAVACHGGRGSGCSRSGYGISPQEEVAINPMIELSELTLDWGNRLLEGTNKTVCTRTQGKEAVTPQETDPDLPVSVQKSPAEHGSAVACCRVGGTECSRAGMHGAFCRRLPLSSLPPPELLPA